MNYKKLKLKSFEMRKKLIEKFFLLKEGHPGSVFSILDILIYLYYSGQVRIKKKKVLDDVIMSKGHATVGQYPILHDAERLQCLYHAMSGHYHNNLSVAQPAYRPPPCIQ